MPFTEHFDTLSPNRRDPPRFLLSKILQSLSGSGTSATATLYTGSGSPNGVVTATPGAEYNQIDGGVFIQTWIKQSGIGNTGWV